MDLSPKALLLTCACDHRLQPLGMIGVTAICQILHPVEHDWAHVTHVHANVWGI